MSVTLPTEISVGRWPRREWASPGEGGPTDGRFRVQRLRVVVLTATFALGAIIALGSTNATRADAALALLEPSAQTVFVRQGESDFVATMRAVVLNTGDAVRTDATGRGVITYADGTTAVIEPDTEITIEDLRQNGPDLLVLISQNAGHVWYELSRTLSPNTRYEVRSSSLAAVVRAGSTVEFAVDPNGDATVTAVDGSADATAGGTTVTVTTGTTTTASGGSAPAPLVPASATPPVMPTPMPTATPNATMAPLVLPPLPVMTVSPTPTAAPTATPKHKDGKRSSTPTPTRSTSASDTSWSSPTPTATPTETPRIHRDQPELSASPTPTSDGDDH